MTHGIGLRQYAAEGVPQIPRIAASCKCFRTRSMSFTILSRV